MTTLTFPALVTDPKKLSDEIAELRTLCQRSTQQVRGTHAFTLVYDVSKTEKNKVFEVASYMNEGACSSLKLTIDSDEAYGTCNLKRGLSLKHFTGNEFERRVVSFKPPEESSFWDTWEDRLPDISSLYDKFLHPKIAETVQKIVSLKRQMANRILDIGGGSGKLATKICHLAKQVVVIDSSKKALAKAKERSDKIETRLQDIDDIEEERESVDIVILCGVVASQVLDKQKARDLMQKCHAMLCKNGFLIAASHTPSLFNSDKYKEFGFEVHNKSLIYKTDQGHKFNDFYILEKK